MYMSKGHCGEDILMIFAAVVTACESSVIWGRNVEEKIVIGY
jgi:hypothetical protein